MTMDKNENPPKKKTLTDAHVIMHIVYNIQVSIKGECQASSILYILSTTIHVCMSLCCDAKKIL